MRWFKWLIPFMISLSVMFATACGPAGFAGRTPGAEPQQEQADPDSDRADMELITAAAQGDVQAVTRLLEKGADVQAADANGVTPLIAAAYRNHLDVAQVLVEAGADVNTQDRTKQSAYLISTSEGYLELLQLTLAAGADVHSLDSYNGTGLIRAADRGHVEIIAELLKTDIDLDHINRLGWTALLEAIILGDGGPRHTEVVRLLVEAGADVNQTDGQGVTPLEHARMRGFEEIAAILENADNEPGPTQPPPATQTPTPTPHPLFTFTIPGLRARTFEGGPIRVRSVLDQNEAFTLNYIEYPSDGLAITGLMHLPAGEGPFPVLILLHGYFDRDNYFTGADTWQAAEFFSRRGYLVLAPDFRSWGESDTGLSLFHTGLVADVLSLINSLDSLPEADINNIGLWGHSMGGGIATKVLAVADPRLKAAVLYAPNSADDADLIARWGAGCLPGQSETAGDRCNPAEVIPPDTPQELIDAYQAAAADPEFLRQVAPLYHLEAITAPVQIHIGTADGQFLVETPPQWSEKLADALQAAGKEVEYYTYQDQGHAFTGESWTTFLTRALDFYDIHLK